MQNFTKMTDLDLKLGSYRQVLGTLVYWRVLKTSDLFAISKYPHGIKSFRKLIQKFKSLELVGTISEGCTEEQFIYPREVALKYFKGERFNDFSLYNDELTSIKFYNALFKIVQELKEKPNFISSHSYINAEEATYDFLVKFKLNYPLSFAFFIFFEEDEVKIFQKINQSFESQRPNVVIILTNHHYPDLQRDLNDNYFKTKPRRGEKVLWLPLNLNNHSTVYGYFNGEEYQMPLSQVVSDGITLPKARIQ